MRNLPQPLTKMQVLIFDSESVLLYANLYKVPHWIGGSVQKMNTTEQIMKKMDRNSPVLRKITVGTRFAISVVKQGL